jgi:hypothetical protein
MNFLDFYAGSESNYMVYLETKKIPFNFHQILSRVKVICICSKNVIIKNIDFQKNIAECGIKTPG